MKRLLAIRFMSASCSLLAVTMLVYDIANHRSGIDENHGYFIVTLILIGSALELVRSELIDLRKKLGE